MTDSSGFEPPERHASDHVRARYVRFRHTGSRRDRRRARRAARVDGLASRLLQWSIAFRWRHVKRLITPEVAYVLTLVAIAVTATVLAFVLAMLFTEPPVEQALDKPTELHSPAARRPAANEPRPHGRSRMRHSPKVMKTSSTAQRTPVPGCPLDDPDCVVAGVRGMVRECVGEELAGLPHRIQGLPPGHPLVTRVVRCLEKETGTRCTLSPLSASSLLRTLDSARSAAPDRLHPADGCRTP